MTATLTDTGADRALGQVYLGVEPEVPMVAF